jgi:hypothetical protein
MTTVFHRLTKKGVHTLAALSLTAAAGGALAADLPDFTLSPSGAGLTGANVTADNIIVSDYATVRLSGTTFTETGFLSVQTFQLDNEIINAAGLNDTYSLYVQFTGSGTTSGGDPTSVITNGSFDSLDYTLYGVNGKATFGFDGSGDPMVSGGSGAVALASGSLMGDSFVSTNPAMGSFFANAGATLSFNINDSVKAFFASPDPFYSAAFSSFTNTPTQVTPFDGGFRITQGGGSFNMAQPIPEQETYALMLAGLGVVAWVARRRRPDQG